MLDDPPDPGLPSEPLRAHALAHALRTTETFLRDHGFADVERCAEILYIALTEAFAEANAPHDDLN